MMRNVLALGFLVASLIRVTPVSLTSGSAHSLGPIPYKSFADSPFKPMNLTGFHLEDFEDHLFNTPGVRANVGIVTSTQVPGAIVDSVDGDVGNPVNGTCMGCDSYYHSSGPQGITFTFDPGSPGGLPTHAGIVWTDGEGTTTFEAFDSAGVSLGVIGPDGISAIEISNNPGGIEVDHLQYGHLVTCFDKDGDGYGSPGDASCPAGSADGFNDNNPRISPREAEIDGGLDDNCSGLVDEGLDLYGDGFDFALDCDDGDPRVNPGAPEACNGMDDNCDGRIDEGFDRDGDGFTVCQGDCDDLDARVHPGATELPGNTVDENCDGALGACDPLASRSNHGEFVRCVAREVVLLVAGGVITDQQGDVLVRAAALSDIGR